MSSAPIFDYLLYALLAGYGVVVIRFLYRSKHLAQTKWLALAMVSWPLFMLDEWIRLWQLDAFLPLYGLGDVFAVMLMSACYRMIKPMLLAHPTRRRRLWIPLAITALSQCAILLIPASEKALWLGAAPSGAPLNLWPAYLPALLTGFSVLLLGIFITEQVQMYHHHLPEQVVDVREFRIKGVTGASGATVGVAFTSILMVTAATFGFFALPFWQSLHHVIIGLSLLAILYALTRQVSTSPSPLDYQRLDIGEAKPAEMREVISRAERAVIKTKAYKQLGLTLKSFSHDAGVDPTTLAIALQLEQKKNFRSFIYQYRLDYAKKVLLRSDANISSVAKRLGLNSEKFLGDVLVKHFQSHP
ncbi:helix-turn-helix domain-containing protein [Alteromonas australica]|uniref:DNA mismatch repair protein n=1 Tax=Alteromonas australica TaxID=589873 RepID=A0A075NT44_9ALTE|nr:DNA mismatch repair protein [Alteromonas australica]AIF97744.1 DNA mismatch repair protein [Alteromonas australica]